MSDSAHPAVHPAPTTFIRKWVFSTDHKIIGIQYYFLALIAVFTGLALFRADAAAVGLARRVLALAGDDFSGGFEGGVMSPEFYLAMLTMHGTIMVFFVLTTAPQGGFGNYFLPIQIGAHDMAFPVLNMLSFWSLS